MLRRLYRGKLLALLQEAYQAGSLEFHGRLTELRSPAALDRLLAQARSLEWVVYAKPPLGGPEAVLKYLARYTHRVAISNHRLVEVTDQHVRFTWKDSETQDPGPEGGTETEVSPTLEGAVCPECKRGRMLYHHALPPPDSS